MSKFGFMKENLKFNNTEVLFLPKLIIFESSKTKHNYWLLNRTSILLSIIKILNKGFFLRGLFFIHL
jgi:hypothetical protein